MGPQEEAREGGRRLLTPTSTTQSIESEDILMMADSQKKGKQKVEVHYVIAGVPYVIEENYEGFYHDNGADMIADFLQSQEIAYQSFQGTQGNDVGKASSSNPKSDRGRGQISGSTSVGNPSRSMDFEEQLAVDEAIARELQYVEDNLAATSLSDMTTTEAGDEHFHSVVQETSPTPADGVATFTSISTSTGVSDLVTAQDDIDPDNMTYEELQSLGEAIGTESRGLSDKLISLLKTSTYRTGFFSRKEKNEEYALYATRKYLDPNQQSRELHVQSIFGIKTQACSWFSGYLRTVTVLESYGM